MNKPHGRTLWLIGATTAAVTVSMGGFSPAIASPVPAGYATTMVAAHTGGDQTRTSSPFRDVSPLSQFHDEITWLYRAGITTGFADGDFHPEAMLSRAALAAFLYRLAGSPDVSQSEIDTVNNRFKDLNANTKFDRAIAWLFVQRSTTGYADGTFRPGSPVTRAAIAAFLYRHATHDHDDPASNFVAGVFTDVTSSTRFAGDITWLADKAPTEAGAAITTGYRDGTFRPNIGVKRNAAAAFLERLAMNVTHLDGMGAGGAAEARMPPTIITSSLAAATYGESYLQAVTVKNAASVGVAGLPSGLSYRDGEITGTPSSLGVSTITITAHGASDVTKTLTLQVDPTLVLDTAAQAQKFAEGLSGIAELDTITAMSLKEAINSSGASVTAFGDLAYDPDSHVISFTAPYVPSTPETFTIYVNAESEAGTTTLAFQMMIDDV